MKTKSLGIIFLLVCCLLLCINYFSTNYADFIGLRADFYFKKNQIEKAQEYYEKAFDLGLDDLKRREIYINTIINSPLTIENQEKLVAFIKNSEKDSAYYKAEFFLNNLKKEVDKKYYNNYITNTVYNQKIVRWGKLPITYWFKNKEDAPDYFVDEIRKAFIEWEKATEHQILFAEEENNPNVIIEFATHNPADPEGRKFVVAYTTPFIQLNKLKNMEIVFYLKDPNENFFDSNQVYRTALHEIVHAMGFMGHSNERGNVMYLTKNQVFKAEKKEDFLTDADINTVKLLYKIKPHITNAEEINSEYIPYLILGDEESINNEKIKEAKIYIKKAPNLSAGYIDLAEGFVASKDYLKAIKCLEKALDLADNDDIRSMIYFNLAVTHYYTKQYESAYEYLQESIGIHDSDDKHYLLAEIYTKTNNLNDAIAEYTYLIEKNPKSIEYAIALTNIYIKNKDFVNARKVLKHFIKNNPNEKNNPKLKSYRILKICL